MARKRTPEAEVCETCILALKDVISDLEKIGSGRGTEERFRVVSELLFQVSESLRSIDPMWARIRAKDEARARSARTLTDQSAPAVRLLPGF